MNFFLHNGGILFFNGTTTAFITMDFLRLNLSNFKIDHWHKYIGIHLERIFLPAQRQHML